jgi:EasF-like predicted methyltransferase
MVSATPDITDIRSSTVVDLRKSIVSALRQDPPTLPTLILYDERGLKLFEKITYLDQYYLTNCEISILKSKSDEIVKRMGLQDGGIVVELGSGYVPLEVSAGLIKRNLRKTALLLDALEKLKLNLTYYALDLDRQELVRSLKGLKSNYTHVKIEGLHGTYDDGIAYLKDLTKPKSILWLGSSIANMDREDSAEFLQRFPMNPGDTWVIGIDRRKDAFKVWRAYNDSEGVTRDFELNGLRNANNILGKEEFKDGEWDYVGEYDAEGGRHEAWFVPLKDVTVCGVKFTKGDKILVERSYKYGKREVEELWEKARVVEVGHWSDPEKAYGKASLQASLR